MEDIKVFISSKEVTCVECGSEFDRRAWITLKDQGAVCLECADLEHLSFLPAGDAAVTRRSRKYSNLVAVVLKWSRARKRYERQGLLVEESALEKAEEECAKDEGARKMARARAAERRAELDQEYIKKFGEKIRSIFPGCPPGREQEIAKHACTKYTGRVGRSAAAKELNEDAVKIAVIAHIRHRETKYDDYLMSGMDRFEARQRVQSEIEELMEKWY